MSRPDDSTPLAQWLAYLESLHHTEIELGLERVRQVAARLTLTYPFRVITVGGTNGKGSVCAMLEAILHAAGYHTGSYTSPHLVHYNERIRVNGEFATDEQIVKQFYRIDQAREEISLTYFEFSTLAALLLFVEQGVDVAILEVGLGGRLDAVNIVDTDCAIITSIDVDHAEYLGTTRDAVAHEKAHIFRANKPAICADPLPPQSLLDYAEKTGADLWLFGKDFNYSGDQLQWAYGGRGQRRSALAYPALRGANQLLNAAATLAALEALRPELVVPAHALRLGFLHAALPGRFQILPGQPTVILDVAHNPHAAAALGQNLAHMPHAGKTFAVVGMFKDKDIQGVLAHLVDHVDHWFCASLAGNRGLQGRDLALQVRTALQKAPENRQVSVAPNHDGLDFPQASQGVPAVTDPSKPAVRPAVRTRYPSENASVAEYTDPVSAYNAACEQASVNDRILVFGSFATVGPVLNQHKQTDT